jgi:general secretion pathway protein A
VPTVGERAVSGYESYYGLVESPFSLTPNPRFLFESRSHSAAFEHVTYALRRREALVVVTGEIGTGKTMLCRTVLQRLEPRTFLSVVTDPLLSSDDLLTQVLDDFGLLTSDPGRRATANRHDLIRTLQQFLASLGSLQAHAVIMIDEAQHLQPEVLEQIRLLSNFETEESKLLQIILVGQPDLEDLLARPEMRQLEQRISRRHRLEALAPDEVQRYIERRLWVAHGGPATYLGRGPSHAGSGPAAEPVAEGEFWRVRFTPAAMRLIARLSGGLPRVINVLCDRALEVGYEMHQAAIDRGAVSRAARELKIRAPHRLNVRPVARLAAAALLIAAVGVGLWWSLRVVDGQPSSPGALAAPAATERVETQGGPSGGAPPPPPAAQTAAAPAVAPLPGGESFTIVVASFRTETRATSVAHAVTALGLPAFTRNAPGGWRQILVGPYASRAEAVEAQQKLASALMPDTVIVPNLPPGTAGAAGNDSAVSR